MQLWPCTETMNDTWLCDAAGGRGSGGHSSEQDGQRVVPPLVDSTGRCHGRSNTVPLHNHTHIHFSASLVFGALLACAEGMLTRPALPGGLYREADITRLLVAVELHVPTPVY